MATGRTRYTQENAEPHTCTCHPHSPALVDATSLYCGVSSLLQLVTSLLQHVSSFSCFSCLLLFLLFSRPSLSIPLHFGS